MSLPRLRRRAREELRRSGVSALRAALPPTLSRTRERENSCYELRDRHQVPAAGMCVGAAVGPRRTVGRKIGQDRARILGHRVAMQAPPPQRPDLLAAVVGWIEQHLDDSLTLERIAAEAGMSPYHFSRLFTVRMGHSVMEHVRGRRLVKSARRLVSEPDVKLMALALDTGFDSQEAYTRAFKRVFGVTPGRFRSGFSITPLEGHFPMTMPKVLKPQIAQRPEPVYLDGFTVAGFTRRFDVDSKSQIPQLWSRLVGHLPFDGQIESMRSFGVAWRSDAVEGCFEYMAAVEVKSDARVPDGMQMKTIPPGAYLAFTLTLAGGPLHAQIKAAMAEIWGERIPATGLQTRDSPDFEIYDGSLSPGEAGQKIDYYVAVEV